MAFLESYYNFVVMLLLRFLRKTFILRNAYISRRQGILSPTRKGFYRFFEAESRVYSDTSTQVSLGGLSLVLLANSPGVRLQIQRS